VISIFSNDFNANRPIPYSTYAYEPILTQTYIYTQTCHTLTSAKRWQGFREETRVNIRDLHSI